MPTIGMSGKSVELVYCGFNSHWPPFKRYNRSMLFTVYRTTNKVNGKYYFGVHKTENPMDEYLGSGKFLKRAIVKYGVENFVKEILLSSHSPEAAFALEFELVEEHRGNPLCYNLRQGGAGGFDYINKAGLNGTYFMKEDSVKRRAESKRKKFETDELYRKRVLDNLDRIRLRQNPEVREKNRLKAVAKWKGGHQSPENCQKFSEMRTGSGNPNFGIKWMNKEGIPQRIPIDDVQLRIKDGWMLGKKEVPKKERKITIFDLTPEGMNWCSTHKQYLSIDNFHRDKNKPSGYKQKCIECRKKRREGKDW